MLSKDAKALKILLLLMAIKTMLEELSQTQVSDNNKYHYKSMGK